MIGECSYTSSGMLCILMFSFASQAASSSSALFLTAGAQNLLCLNLTEKFGFLTFSYLFMTALWKVLKLVDGVLATHAGLACFKEE